MLPEFLSIIYCHSNIMQAANDDPEMMYMLGFEDEYEQAFLQGLQDAGIKLPDNWHITIHLLNLLSLLDCLIRSDPKNRPNQCKDIKELIGYILDELETS